MNKDELATVNDLEEQARKLKVLFVGEFEVLKQLIEEQSKPYIYWGEHLSLKQAIKYTGRTRSCIDTWVKEGLLSKPYRLGGSTSTYYSRNELSTIRARWQAIVNEQAKKILKVV